MGVDVMVFICYETTTGKEFASHLKAALSRVRIDSFVADEDIPKGSNWKMIVDQAIKDCKYFVAVITIQACYSDEVKREIELANDFHKLVLPCRYGGIDRSLTSRLPIVGLETQQIDFTSPTDLANKVTRELFKRESTDRLRATLETPRLSRFTSGEAGSGIERTLCVKARITG